MLAWAAFEVMGPLAVVSAVASLGEALLLQERTWLLLQLLELGLEPLEIWPTTKEKHKILNTTHKQMTYTALLAQSYSKPYHVKGQTD